MIFYDKVCKTCLIKFVGPKKKEYCKVTHTPAYLKAKRARKRIERARKGRAMPPWASREQVLEIYNNRPKGTEVDHIIPLNHPEVCGLHIPCNLQYLSKSDNIKKRNYFDGTNDNNGWRGY